VLLQDEREFEARIVGADPDSDLAVLQISSKKPLPSVHMDQIGVLPGDVIRQIEDLSVSDTETFVTAMIKHRYKPALIVLLQRQDALYHLTVRMSP
jgi:S1-C subfamily serine protease